MKPWERYQAPVEDEEEKAGPWAAYAAPKPAPEPEEEQGLIGRSLDRLQLGLSDTMSTLAGDTYGRSGDPTERDDLPLINPFGSNRLMKFVGGDVIPALGDVAGDALVTGGKAVLPKAAEDAIASGVERVASSDAAQAAGRGLEKAKEALGPEGSAYLGEAFNIMLAGTPVKKPKVNIRKKGLEKLRGQNKQARLKEVDAMISPDYKEGVTKFEIVNGRKKMIRSEVDARVAQRVADTPGVDPRKSYTDNARALEKEASKIDGRLKGKLLNAPTMKRSDVDKVIDDVMAELSGHYTIVGAAEDSAKKIRKQLDGILDGSTTKHKWPHTEAAIRPEALLKVRQALDKELLSQGKKIAGSDSGQAFDVATRKIRTRINKAVDEAAPNIEVADDLSKQADLLSARDIIEPRSGKEAASRPGRWIENLERDTGVRHPTTPQAIASGATSVPTLLLSLGLITGRAGKRGGKALSRTMDANIKSIVDDLISKGVPASQRAAILSALQDEEDR